MFPDNRAGFAGPVMGIVDNASNRPLNLIFLCFPCCYSFSQRRIFDAVEGPTLTVQLRGSGFDQRAFSIKWEPKPFGVLFKNGGIAPAFFWCFDRPPPSGPCDLLV